MESEVELVQRFVVWQPGQFQRVAEPPALAQSDFFFEEQRADGSGGRGFLVNEINTIPGFVAGVSQYPRLWEESGLSYPDLLDRLIELAFARHERRAKRAGRQRDE